MLTKSNSYGNGEHRTVSCVDAVSGVEPSLHDSAYKRIWYVIVVMQSVMYGPQMFQVNMSRGFCLYLLHTYLCSTNYYYAYITYNTEGMDLKVQLKSMDFGFYAPYS